MTDTLTETDVTVLFEELDVLRRGHFRLSSGKHSDTYLQCALALQQPAVALRLGRTLAQRLTGYDVDLVVSPALGGLLAGFVVAAALETPFVFTERDAQRRMTLRRGQRVEAGAKVLVVEDVITTGGSATEAAAVCQASDATVVGIAALVDRSAGLGEHERPPFAPTALLHVTAHAWGEDTCPQCLAGVPLDTPGSRHAN